MTGPVPCLLRHGVREGFRHSPDGGWRNFRAGNGSEERRLRRRQIRLQGSRRGPLESHRADALRARHRQQAKARSSRAARSAPRPASIPAARPKDKHTVVDALTENTVWWDGNRKLTQANFDLLLADFIAHARGKTLYAQDLYGGADPKYRIKTRVFTEYAWHSLFIRQLLIRPERSELADFVPEFTIVDLPSFKADPKRHGVPHRHHHRHRLHQEDHPDRQLVLRRRDEEVGVHHAQLLPAGAGRHADALLGQRRQGRRRRAVLRPLRHRQDHALGRSQPHADRRRRARLVARTACSTSRAAATPSASSSRAEAEPEIYAATNRFGAVLENVVFDPETAHPDFDDDSRRPRTPARPIRSTSCRTPRAPAAPAIRRTSSSSPPTPSA